MVCSQAIAQTEKFDQSDALDLPLSGVYKTLCMKNGGTALLHLQKDGIFEVLIFDSSHKLQNQATNRFRYIDGFNSYQLIFKGLYEINGDIALFTETDKNGKELFIRTLIDGKTGKLLGEAVLGSYPSVKRKISILVLKNPEEPGYEILYCNDNPVMKNCDFKVVYYGADHEEIRTVNLEVPRKQFDFLILLGAQKTENGIILSIGLDKEVVYSNGGNHEAMMTEKSSIYHHYIYNALIPNDTGKISKNVLDASTENYPYFSLATFNPFAGMLNVLVYCYKQIYRHFGMDFSYNTLQKNLLLVTNPIDMKVTATELSDSLMTRKAYGKNSKNTFWGVPVMMKTNKYGLTTLISQSFSEFTDIESYGRNPSEDIWCLTCDSTNSSGGYARRVDFAGSRNIDDLNTTSFDDHGNEINNNRVKQFKEDFFTDIGYSQLGDDGQTIWDTVLPLRQFRKSRRHFYILSLIHI